jgi:hypothetical protein
VFIGQPAFPRHVLLDAPSKMFRETRSISVASVSDLIARFVAIAQKAPVIAFLCDSEFYKHYHHARCQLERLQKLCQRYSSLKFVYYLRREDSPSAELTSVTFCAARTDPPYANEDPLTATLRLLDLAEQMQEDVQTRPHQAGQSPSSQSDFGGASSEADHLSCKEVNYTQSLSICAYTKRT